VILTLVLVSLVVPDFALADDSQVVVVPKGMKVEKVVEKRRVIGSSTSTGPKPSQVIGSYGEGADQLFRYTNLLGFTTGGSGASLTNPYQSSYYAYLYANFYKGGTVVRQNGGQYGSQGSAINWSSGIVSGSNTSWEENGFHHIENSSRNWLGGYSDSAIGNF